MTSMLETIRLSLQISFDDRIVDELLEAYEEVKHRFYTGDLGPQAVFGGKFCEAAFRLLEEAVSGPDNYTPLGNNLPNVDTLMSRLAGDRKRSPTFSEKWQQDSIGLHVPRALRIIYDVRNHRDAAHLADSIDPNQQDAMLVVTVLDWVMAEFVRLSHDVSPDRAQQIVQDLVTRKITAIQVFDGQPKLLKTGLRPEDLILAYLYYYGARGVVWDDLIRVLPEKHHRNLGTHLQRLEDDSCFVHWYKDTTGVYQITNTGVKYVEERKLLE